MAKLPEWIIKRAGGRRRYNAERKRARALRRHKVARMSATMSQREIARRLRVHESTISRDSRAIFSFFSPERRCPLCGQCYALATGDTCRRAGAKTFSRKGRKRILVF